MIRVCRLTRAIYATPASRAYDGHGSALNGQRWNPRGARAAYASASLSLATLEYLGTLVDINDAPADLVAVTPVKVFVVPPFGLLLMGLPSRAAYNPVAKSSHKSSL